MANTGRKIYSNLRQIYLDTGSPTGEDDKPNVPSDPDYIPPVVDHVSCPPDSAPPAEVNKLAIRVTNNSNQAIALQNLIIRAQSIADLLYAYVNRTDYSIFPNTIDNSFDPKDQLDSITHVEFKVKALSSDLPVFVRINYKKDSEGSFTNHYSQEIGEDDVISVPIPTDMEIGSNTNTLEISFDDV